MTAIRSGLLREKLTAPGAARLVLGVVAIAVLGSALVLLAGSNPLTALSGIVAGSFGERYTIAETLVSAIPLALIGLSVAPALRAGVFTVGSEGQLAIGAMCATAAIFAVPDAPPLSLTIFAAVAGAFGGAAWALLPALLRAYGRVNEILSTLLLNYIAGFFLLWSLRSWLATPEIVPLPQSAPLPDAALIPKLLEGTRLHWGFVLLPIAALALAWWLRSSRGFAYQVVATHPALANRMGLTQARAIITTMLVSGAIAGLAGWLQVAGVAQTLYPGVAGGLGFAGVLVALLGRLNPVGILVASLFFAAIETGADGLQAGTGVPSAISIIVQGLVLLVATLSVAAQGVRKATPRTPAAQIPAQSRAEFEGAQS